MGDSIIDGFNVLVGLAAKDVKQGKTKNEVKDSLFKAAESFSVSVVDVDVEKILSLAFNQLEGESWNGVISSSGALVLRYPKHNTDLKIYKTGDARKPTYKTEIHFQDRHVKTVSSKNLLHELKPTSRKEFLDTLKTSGLDNRTANEILLDAGAKLNEHLKTSEIPHQLNGGKNAVTIPGVKDIRLLLNGNRVNKTPRTIAGETENIVWIAVTLEEQVVDDDGNSHLQSYQFAVYNDNLLGERGAAQIINNAVIEFSRCTVHAKHPDIADTTNTLYPGESLDLKPSPDAITSYLDGDEIPLIEDVLAEIIIAYKMRAHILNDYDYTAISIITICTYFSNAAEFLALIHFNASFGAGKTKTASLFTLLAFFGELVTVPRIAPTARYTALTGGVTVFDDWEEMSNPSKRNRSPDTDELLSFIRSSPTRGTRYKRCEEENVGGRRIQKPEPYDVFQVRGVTSINAMDRVTQDRVLDFTLPKKPGFRSRLPPKDKARWIIDALHLNRLERFYEVVSLYKIVRKRSEKGGFGGSTGLLQLQESDDKKTTKNVEFSVSNSPKNAKASKTSETSQQTEVLDTFFREVGNVEGRLLESVELSLAICLLLPHERAVEVARDLGKFTARQWKIRTSGTHVRSKEEASLFSILVNPPTTDNRYSPSLIAGWVQEAMKWEDVKPNSIGYALKRMGLSPVTKSSKNYYLLTPDIVVGLVRDHAVAPPPNTVDFWKQKLVDAGVVDDDYFADVDDGNGDDESPNLKAFEDAPEDEIVNHLLETRKSWGNEAPKLEEWVSQTKCRPALDDVPVDRIRGIATRLLDAETHKGGRA